MKALEKVIQSLILPVLHRNFPIADHCSHRKAWNCLEKDTVQLVLEGGRSHFWHRQDIDIEIYEQEKIHTSYPLCAATHYSLNGVYPVTCPDKLM